MPTDNRPWLHKNECVFTSGPESPQQNSENPIRSGEARARMLERQCGKLLSKCQIFEDKIAMGAKDPVASVIRSINRRNILHFRIGETYGTRRFEIRDCAADWSFREAHYTLALLRKTSAKVSVSSQKCSEKSGRRRIASVIPPHK